MRDGWRRVTLGDIAEVVGGGTPRTSEPSFWGGEIQWITPTEVVAQSGSVITSTARSLTAAGLKGSGARLLPTGSVLLTSRATVGAVGLTGCPMATNQGFASLVPGDAVLADFLMFWCQANVSEFQMRAGGSTFPEINRGAVREVALDLPPLDEQRRIVDLLGTLGAYGGALTTTRARVRAVKRLVLHDHFRGSPSRAGKRFALGDLINLKRGFDLPAGQRVRGNVPVVSSAGVTGVHSIAKVPGPGVVIGRYGTLGQVHFLDGPCWPLNTTLYVEDFGGMNPRYVAYMLESLDLTGHSEKSAVPGVNRNTLHQISVCAEETEAEQLRVAGDLHALDLLDEALDRATESLSLLRSGLLRDLLGGDYSIPSTYDRFLEAA